MVRTRDLEHEAYDPSDSNLSIVEVQSRIVAVLGDIVTVGEHFRRRESSQLCCTMGFMMGCIASLCCAVMKRWEFAEEATEKAEQR